jgi:3-deoxy-D-manno-octulosonate 8-phosphate phosphatase (KDO 8-P phosphatase)
VDGVFTDGGFLLGEREDLRRFHAHDGIGVKLADRAGLPIILISRRKSGAVLRRARELGLESHLGILDKVRVLDRCLVRLGCTRREAAFLGDDLQDLDCLRAVGFPMATANAVPAVKAAARAVTRKGGGDGAVREAIEILLAREGRLEETIARFLEADRAGGRRAANRSDRPAPRARARRRA